MLLAQKADAAGVAFDVGYESASQFSREYRRLFGAPPGRDMIRLRNGPTEPQRSSESPELRRGFKIATTDSVGRK